MTTEMADQAVRRADFYAGADGRFAKIVESGTTILWSDMRHFLEQRLAGKQMARPLAKKKRAWHAQPGNADGN
jgi:hypothetical protein